jgi:hypothetical protein
MGECSLTHFMDAMCWTVVAASLIWGAIAGWCYYEYQYSKTLLRLLLHILYRIRQRGVYMSPYDLAMINVAIDHVTKKRA